MTPSINDTQHNNALPRTDECRVLFNIMLSNIMLNVIMLSVVMLSVVILSVVMLSVVMLCVVAPRNLALHCSTA